MLQAVCPQRSWLASLSLGFHFCANERGRAVVRSPGEDGCADQHGTGA